MKFTEYIPGFLAVFVLASFSYYISTLHPSFDALAISIILGMFAGNLLADRDVMGRGVELAIKIFLPLGIALYGTQLVVVGLKFSLVLVIVVVFLLLFGLTMVFSRIFGLERNLGVLLSSGLSICGASAIAVISPLIGAKREDTSISLISVMMLGLTGMIFYPILFDLFELTRIEYNFLIGATLPMIGQVKVAAANVCPECVDKALQVKLIRVSFLLFLVTAASFISNGQARRIRIPWFVIAFILLAITRNSTDILNPYRQQLGMASSFFLSSALTGIGLSVDFDSIVEKGIRPLAVIFLSWFLVLAALLTGMNLIP